MEGSQSALPSVLDPDMDVKVFYWKYGKDYPSATFEQWDAAYNEYKDFYAKYHQDNPGATTNCYEEYLKTKQEEQRGEEFEYCYWFCAILQERQLEVVSWGRADRSRARFIRKLFGLIEEQWRENNSNAAVACILYVGSPCYISLKFAELREAFHALSRSEQDIFLMAQLKAMNGGEITASRRLKKKTRTNKRTFYY
ncbi:hypothetical protein G9A89_022287 [Geosiphon pyriformis]|nr:hypothetical protein G9A89_022287 [Geosiphon pyriformis]